MAIEYTEERGRKAFDALESLFVYMNFDEEGEMESFPSGADVCDYASRMYHAVGFNVAAYPELQSQDEEDEDDEDDEDDENEDDTNS